jgi:hypothetical protein
VPYHCLGIMRADLIAWLQKQSTRDRPVPKPAGALVTHFRHNLDYSLVPSAPKVVEVPIKVSGLLCGFAAPLTGFSGQWVRDHSPRVLRGGARNRQTPSGRETRNGLSKFTCS